MYTCCLWDSPCACHWNPIRQIQVSCVYNLRLFTVNCIPQQSLLKNNCMYTEFLKISFRILHYDKKGGYISYVRIGTRDTRSVAILFLYLHLYFVSSWNVLLRQNWHCTFLAPFYFGVPCSWFIAFLRHCARVVVGKEMSDYLSVCVSLPHFLIPLQMPPTHLLNITMLVCPNWCVF